MLILKKSKGGSLARNLFSASALCALIVTQAQASEDWLEGMNEPLVSAITPTRIKKSALEQPVSVTVLDREFILATGASEIAELMAFVPGMARGFRANREQSIAYHGLSSVNPKRMQVLIDGMSIYDAGLSKVDWRHIPLTVNQIERIEITRSPSAAVYGTNSFSGIINFISRKVSEQDNLVLSATRSTDETSRFNIASRFGDADNAIALHYEYQTDTGFKDTKDDSKQHRVKIQHAVSGVNWQSTTQVSYVEDDFDGDHPDEVDQTSSESQDIYLQNQSSWQVRDDLELKVNQYFYQKHSEDNWSSCFHPSFISEEFANLYQQAPEIMAALLAGQIGIQDAAQLPEVAQLAVMNYLSYGGPEAQPVCGSAENYTDQIRKQFELQATWVINDSVKLAAGGYWRQDRLDSNVYLKANGWQNKNALVTFANVEYRVHSDLTFDFALMNEKLAQDKDAFSPRIAVNYKLCQHCSVRFNYSYTEREPGEFEQNGQFKYFIKDIEPNPYQLTQGEYFLSNGSDNQLTSEKMRAWEIGYHYNNWSSGLDLDINFFYQQMTDLINQGVRIEEFIYENDLDADLTGLETELNWQINRNDFIKFNWTQLNWQLKNKHFFNRGLFSAKTQLAGFYAHQFETWQSGFGAVYSDVEEAGELSQLQTYLKKPINLNSYQLILGLNSYYRIDNSVKKYRLAEFDSNWLVSFKAELIW